MTEHTHTDKTLQGNDKIESAIAALQQEPSQEMLAHVLTVIRRRMNEHGELIIAVDPSSAASGLQVQAIRPMTAANGGRHLPASMKNSKVPEA